MSDLQENPSAPLQMPARLIGNPAIEVKAVFVAVQGDVGVVQPHFLLQPLYDAAPDVGRVGHDHVVGAFDPLKKVTVYQAYLRPQRPAVLPRCVKGLRRDVCRVKTAIRKHLPRFVYLESKIGEDPDKRDYIVSNEKIEKTGYLPKYSLDDGIEELIKTYAIIKNNQYGNV